MRLDALVQANHGLKLRRVERVRLLELDTTLEGLPRQALDDIAEVTRQLVAETVINVEFALTGRCQVRVVDDEGLLDKGFVVLLHRQLTRRSLPTTGCRVGRDRTGGRAERLLEVLDVEVERQIILAEVAP